ncbi:MAG TPA: MOSC N-terminal beta barrel domain-containing protein [Ilumatobacter sp.]|nr:MOSC N-terminal beta barrel domain-containing protein [Ilumatobacter sp.]
MDVREIWRYPIKSIGGERLDVANVTELGIEGDRRWGVRDTHTGNILTARRTPALLMATATVIDGLPLVTTVDGDVIDGSLESMSGSLSDWLGQPVELVAAGDDGGTFENPLDVEREADWKSWTGPAHAFHDSGRTRVSLVSAATLDDRDVRRFRINVVLGGGEESAEDALVGERVRVGSVELSITKPIDRCIMVTRAQPGLPADLDVLKRVIRERSNLMGIGSLVEIAGCLSVGDQLVVNVG